MEKQELIEILTKGFIEEWINQSKSAENYSHPSFKRKTLKNVGFSGYQKIARQAALKNLNSLGRVPDRYRALGLPNPNRQKRIQQIKAMIKGNEISKYPALTDTLTFEQLEQSDLINLVKDSFMIDEMVESLNKNPIRSRNRITKGRYERFILRSLSIQFASLLYYQSAHGTKLNSMTIREAQISLKAKGGCPIMPCIKTKPQVISYDKSGNS